MKEGERRRMSKEEEKEREPPALAATKGTLKQEGRELGRSVQPRAEWEKSQLAREVQAPSNEEREQQWKTHERQGRRR